MQKGQSVIQGLNLCGQRRYQALGRDVCTNDYCHGCERQLRIWHIRLPNGGSAQAFAFYVADDANDYAHGLSTVSTRNAGFDPSANRILFRKTLRRKPFAHDYDRRCPGCIILNLEFVAAQQRNSESVEIIPINDVQRSNRKLRLLHRTTIDFESSLYVIGRKRKRKRGAGRSHARSGPNLLQQVPIERDSLRMSIAPRQVESKCNDVVFSKARIYFS